MDKNKQINSSNKKKPTPGAYLKQVRHMQRLSIEELSAKTRISKSRIIAIENENYLEFPAEIYVYALVSQLAKSLKLEHEKIANEYLTRFKQANIKRPDILRLLS